jgi:hypothetical protein
MKNLTTILAILLSGIVFVSCNKSQNTPIPNTPTKVELRKESHGYQIYCDGKPHYIKGAGFEGKNPSSVAKHGGNTIRTWRTGDQFITGQQILDEAYQNGLMVCMGIEIGRERHGFDYDDTAAIRKQLEFARGEVIKYRNHPALLAWGIGNELNLFHLNPNVWNAVEEIAAMIKKEDPNHLVTTMLAGAGKHEITLIKENCPSLDFLSFQLYGDIVNLPKYISESGYDGAYVVSEWGATGHWEVAQTEWKRPIEQNSHDKAMAYKERYEKVIASDTYHCIGSFVFLWGQKQERTPTWYGMFLEDGKRTASVDVMQFLWTGNWPENRAPETGNIQLEGKVAYDNVYLTAGQSAKANVSASDPENDPLTFVWEIMTEVPEKKQSEGGDFEPRPETIFKTNSEGNSLTFKAPEASGDYRLFVYIYDGKGNAATANIPFFVK